MSAPKDGRIRYVPLTKRLAAALQGRDTFAVHACCATRRANR
ncbi:MAG TPA: hypothetical protein VGI12_01945 [Vicinamibacterales bacterium]